MGNRLDEEIKGLREKVEELKRLNGIGEEEAVEEFMKIEKSKRKKMLLSAIDKGLICALFVIALFAGIMGEYLQSIETLLLILVLHFVFSGKGEE